VDAPKRALPDREILAAVYCVAFFGSLVGMVYLHGRSDPASIKALGVAFLGGLCMSLVDTLISVRFGVLFSGTYEERVASRQRNRFLHALLSATGAFIGAVAFLHGEDWLQLMFAFVSGYYLVGLPVLYYDRWYCLPRTIAAEAS
jgi:hypothetical protein